MFENNDNKPKKESELDITELLRRYLPEEYAEEEAADTASAEAEEVPAPEAEAAPAPKAADRRRKRKTARRQIDVAAPEKEAEPVYEAPETDVPVYEEPAEESSDIAKLEAILAEVEGADAEADDVKVYGGEITEADAETEAEPVADVSDHTAVFSIDEINERSFDPDVDIFSEFEDPRDELYDYIDEAFAEEAAEESAPASVEDDEEIDPAFTLEVPVDNAVDGGTMVFDPVSAEVAKAVAEAEDFEVEPEPEAPAENIDDFDLNIMLALGMEEELEESIGAEKVTKFVEKQQGDIAKATSLNRERAALDYEYTTKSQVREVIDAYQTAYRNSKIKIIFAAVLTFVLMLFECHSSFGIELTGAFDPTVYPVVYIMVAFQLLLLVAAPAAKSVYNGICDFFHGKPGPESIAAFAIILNFIYTVVVCFVNGYGEAGLITFNFPIAVGFILLYVYEFINYRREIYSFSIVSSKKPKFALQSLTMADSRLEYDAFSDMMEEDDEAEDIGVLKVECADFVNDYFLRTNRYPAGRKFIGFIVPAVLIIAAVFFAYKYSAGTLYDGMKAALTSALLCLPASVFYMFSHPFYMANLKAHEEESTIIGEGSAEEYADAAVISFDDKNVFPSTNVNVRAINVFGNNRIDRVLYYAASTFCTVGGPLSDVFDLATRDIGYSKNVKLLRTLPGLLEVEVDGSVVAFGTIDALESAGVAIPKPLEAHRNDTFEPTVCVMYMVHDGKFVARMLISYIVDTDFEFIIKQLDRSGMFIGMKTFDPNITEQFLGSQIKLAAYPIRVIRCKSLDDRTRVSDSTGSGLVSKDSPKSVLQTVSLCEKVLHARSINTMILIISLFVSLLVSALSILFGALTLSPLFIAIYAIFWCIPMFIVSKIII